MKDLKYYKENCEEDYLHTPISVLRYITELEEIAETCKRDSEQLCDHEWLLDEKNDCIYCQKCFISR